MSSSGIVGGLSSYLVDSSYGRKNSPDTFSDPDYLNGAWYVTSSGVVDDYDHGVSNSYGRIQSPYTGDHIDIYAVHSDGVVGYHGIHHHGSYGIWCGWSSKSL